MGTFALTVMSEDVYIVGVGRYLRDSVAWVMQEIGGDAHLFPETWAVLNKGLVGWPVDLPAGDERAALCRALKTFFDGKSPAQISGTMEQGAVRLWHDVCGPPRPPGLHPQ